MQCLIYIHRRKRKRTRVVFHLCWERIAIDIVSLFAMEQSKRNGGFQDRLQKVVFHLQHLDQSSFSLAENTEDSIVGIDS